MKRPVEDPESLDGDFAIIDKQPKVSKSLAFMYDIKDIPLNEQISKKIGDRAFENLRESLDEPLDESKLKEALCEGTPESETKGSPNVIVVSLSAIRCVELIRTVKKLVPKTYRVAKLFAKHLKLNEQKLLLDENVVNIAVGTPNRVFKLIDTGNLKTEKVQRLVIDLFLDAKSRTLLDVPEVMKELRELLASLPNVKVLFV